MAKPRIGIIVGSTREGRFADKPTEWIRKIAAARQDIDVEVVDLRDYPLPFFDESAGPAYAPSQKEEVRRWQAKIDELDGYVVIAGEYTHGPTAVLKNALDHVYNEWNNKPVAFVAYGGVGGARAVEQLRLHAVELQMAPIRAGVHILFPDYLAVVQGDKTLDEMEHLNRSASAMLDQLGWWTRALAAARRGESAKAAA